MARQPLIVSDDDRDPAESVEGLIGAGGVDAFSEDLPLDQAPDITRQLIIAYLNGERSHPLDFLLGRERLSRIRAIVDTAPNGVVAERMLLDIVQKAIRRWNAETQDGRRISNQDRAERLEKELWRNRFRKITTRTLLKAASVAILSTAVLALAGAWCARRPVFEDYYNRADAETEDARVMKSLKMAEMAGREDRETPHSGGSLEGASIRFPCVPQGGDAAEDRAATLTASLGMHTIKPTAALAAAGVDLDAREPLAMSVAEAGLGTTVLFTPEQVDAGLPEQLGAVAIEVEGGGSQYYLPTGRFVDDPNGVTSGRFATGELDSTGALMRYYPVGGAGELVCHGSTLSTKPAMVTATLSADLPDVTLQELAEQQLEPDPMYRGQFENYGLGVWYDSYYSRLTESVDFAIRNASNKGVSTSNLQYVVDFLGERYFEKYTLEMLAYVRENSDDEAFGRFTAQINASNVPIFNLGDPAAVAALGGAAGDDTVITSTDNGSLRYIRFKPGDYEKASVFAGIVNAMLSPDPDQPFPVFYRGTYRGPADNAMADSLASYLTRVGSGAFDWREADLEDVFAAIPPKAMAAAAIAQSGGLGDLLQHSSYEDRLKLNKGQEAWLFSLDLRIPTEAEAMTGHLYATIIALSGVTEDSSERDIKRLTRVLSLLQDISEGDERDRAGTLVTLGSSMRTLLGDAMDEHQAELKGEDEKQKRKRRRRGEEDEEAEKHERSVTFYSTSGCGACVKLEAWLKKNNVQYQKLDSSKDPVAEREMVAYAYYGGVDPAYPLIIIDRGTEREEVFGVGFSDEVASRLLDALEEDEDDDE